ncbi:MAG: HAD family phosphatase [Lentisphaerae bacterium]|jgi:beta-phosphoglucomutase-like phosphatase (HAD superfamily)|nr:HAD family phosphatase [Lentisphaerota bacterium]
MKPAAFLFDLDGTLVDTEKVWAMAIVDMVVEAGGRTTLDDILGMVIGRNWLDIHAALQERFPMLGGRSPMEDAVVLRSHYEAHAGDPRSMRIEDSISFYRAVSAIAPCAVVSGSPSRDVAAAIEMCGLTDVTRLILGAGDYARGKPDPSGYLKAAELLGVSPSGCVVVEDSTVGVKSGVAAGMKVLALDRSNAVRQDYTGATWRVGSLAEIDVGKEFGQ